MKKLIPWRQYRSIQRAARITWDAFRHTQDYRAQPCEACGSPAEAHHENYREPLTVHWLCRVHHAARHRVVGGNGTQMLGQLDWVVPTEKDVADARSYRDPAACKYRKGSEREKKRLYMRAYYAKNRERMNQNTQASIRRRYVSVRQYQRWELAQKLELQLSA